MHGKLTITNGKDEGVSIALSPHKKTTIGRGKRCTLSLNDHKVSHFHCQIESKDGRFVLKDMESTNGTYVNGSRVTETLIADHDVIQVGHTSFLFQEQQASSDEEGGKETCAEITQIWNEEDPQPERESEVVQNYRILEPLKEGFPFVYKAEHTIHKNIVALKIFSWGDVSNAQRNSIDTWLSLIASLKNERIAALYDYFWKESELFLVMEYIQGKRVQEIMAKKDRLSEQKALKLACNIVCALDYIHAKGVVHGGLSSHNVFLEEGTRRIKLDDVSLHRVLQESGLEVSEWDHENGPYLPLGKIGDGAEVDVYSVGCMIYFMLTGELPTSKGAPSFSTSLTKKVPEEIGKILETALLRFEFKSVRDFYRSLLDLLQKFKETER